MSYETEARVKDWPDGKLVVASYCEGYGYTLYASFPNTDEGRADAEDYAVCINGGLPPRTRTADSDSKPKPEPKEHEGR